MVSLTATKPKFGESADKGHEVSSHPESPDATSFIGSEDEAGGYFANDAAVDARARAMSGTPSSEPSLGAYELETGQVSAHDTQDSNKALLFVCLGLVVLLGVLYVWG